MQALKKKAVAIVTDEEFIEKILSFVILKNKNKHNKK